MTFSRWRRCRSLSRSGAGVLDISVVGFNDLATSALFEPALTTVQFPVVAAGRKAAEALCLNILKHEPWFR